MKNLILIIPLLTALLSGCALFNKQSTTVDKANAVYVLSKSAADIGTQAALIEKPGLRPQFNVAYTNLVIAGSSGHWSLTSVNAVLGSLPIKELKDPKAQILIGGATSLFELTVGTELNKTNVQPYVDALGNGVRDGIGHALSIAP